MRSILNHRVFKLIWLSKLFMFLYWNDVSCCEIGRAQRPLCHDNDHTPCPQFVSELCIRLWTWLLSWHRPTPPSPTLPSTLYWNYVLGYEIRHTDHFCCHDIEPPPIPHPPYHPTHFVLELWLRIQMKSSAHTIFAMTTTLPHAPTLYWNYVLGYEIRHTDYFCCHDIEPPPSPLPSHPLCIGIMY